METLQGKYRNNICNFLNIGINFGMGLPLYGGPLEYIQRSDKGGPYFRWQFTTVE
jgi:hypothetical protein